MKIKVNDVNEASWRDMQVKSNLPENLRKLEEIAYNLWWCWDSDARNLFRNIDRTAWKEASSNPIRLATVLPYLFYTRGLAGVESGRAAILASVEPIVAALVGVVAFGEPLGLGVVLGLACILATVFLLR